MSTSIPAQIAPGELIDKITILEIKLERMSDAAKLANVRHEWEVLTASRDIHTEPSEALSTLSDQLKQINEALWDIEDNIRDCEREGDFGPTFIELARAVYRTNDVRAQLKRDINVLLGSDLVEEKSYKAY